METLRIAKQIEAVITAITVEGKKSEGLVQAKAEAMRDYDKELAVKSAQLKASLPATLVKDQAKGDCSELLYKKVVAEESLKAHFARLDYLKAQLNGFQSINRHLDSN